MAIGFHVKSAVGRELQQVQAGQVAGGVVEEHVFRARIAGIDAGRVLRSVPAIDRGVVLHAGIAAAPGGVGNLVEQVFRFETLHGASVADGAGGETVFAHDGVHEVIGHADGVVGVLEEDGRVGIGVGRRPVVSRSDQGVCLGFFFRLALDEVDDIGMVDIEDDHLGGAASLAARLDDAGEGVKALHEAERTAGGAAAAEAFSGRTQGREIGAGARSPLEEHTFGLGQGQDGIERVFYRVDEAGRALRRLVAGDAELDAGAGRVPVPVLGVGIGLDAVASYVEPHRRIEGGVLAQKDVRQLVVKSCAVVGRLEIALRQTPVANSFGHASHQGAHAALALGRAERSMQILTGHNIGGGHRPILGNFDIFLLEDGVALGVRDQGGALLPFDFVVGGNASLGEKAMEGEAWGLFAGRGCIHRSRAGNGGGLGGGGSFFFYISHF